MPCKLTLPLKNFKMSGGYHTTNSIVNLRAVGGLFFAAIQPCPPGLVWWTGIMSCMASVTVRVPAS